LAALEHHDGHAPGAPHELAHATSAPAATQKSVYPDPLAGTPDEPKIKPTFVDPPGLTPRHAAAPIAEHITYDELGALDRQRVNTFFSVYFCMTGLHGLHVLIGMGLISWVMLKARTGVFGPAYFTPVDVVGLYWHLVDLIWIFLFPLLYLIH
jgi:cytochrome c oxidase subunit 3